MTHTLRVLSCGSITLERQNIFFFGGEQLITVPVMAYLIEHPRGNVLFDSGFPLEIATDKSWYDDLPFEIGMTSSQHVRRQVELAGVDPDSIRYVVCSHLHWDHIGGIGAFPAAEFVVTRQEFDYAHAPDDWLSAGAYQLKAIDRPGVRWKIIDLDEKQRTLDLYGDGRVVIVFSPGHSSGLVSLLARLDTQTVLLTADAADTVLHFEKKTLAFFVDLPAQARTLANLHRLVRDNDVDRVIHSHDVDQWQSLLKSPEAYR